MVKTVEEIKKTKKQFVDFYHEKVKEQKTDQEFYDDNFRTSIKAPYHIERTGSAARIIDIACESVDTSNPIVSCKPRKKGEKEEARALKRSILGNHIIKSWLEEISEAKKNLMLRGEAFGQIEYNDNYDKDNDRSLPVTFVAPDPMIIFPDPQETGGIPNRVVKSCSMNIGQVKSQFPNWKNSNRKRLDDSKGIDYLAYFDAGTRYIEADEQPILGPQVNIFGATPFVHCYSGMGKKSPEGKPETKIVGRLRKVRGILVQDCEMASRIASQIALFTDPVLHFEKVASDAEAEPKEEEVRFVPGGVLISPYGWKINIKQGEIPGAQMYQYYYQIQAKLGLETPPIAMGMPSTSRATGRQEDIYSEQYSKQYRTLKKNLEKMLSTSLTMALKIIDTVPGILPITLRATTIENGKEIKKEETVTKEDLDGYYDSTVEFKADEEITENRNFVKYERLAGAGRVSWKTLLKRGLNYSDEEADEEMTETLAEMAWRTNPQMLSMVLQDALEKAGENSLLRKMEQQATQQAQMAQTPYQGGGVRPSEAQNPLAKEIMRSTINESPRPTRLPPGGV